MVCKFCKEKPVIKLPNSEVALCKSCYIKYFEKKVKKTISDYKLIQKNDHIVVACSGGKDSTVLLYLIKKIVGDRKDIKITALAIDEGIHGYRDKSLEFLKDFCKKQKVNLEIFSYKKEFGKSLDEILKTYKGVRHSQGQPTRGQRTRSHFRVSGKAVGVQKSKVGVPKPAAAPAKPTKK